MEGGARPRADFVSSCGGGGRLWMGVGRVGRSEAASKDNDWGRRLLKGG